MKLGRKPVRFTEKTRRSLALMTDHLNTLGAPPAASNDYVKAVDAVVNGNWGMLGNDQYGDCVEADCGHMLMLRTANTGTIVIPTDQAILALYGAVTGFSPGDPNSDNGTDETSMCEYMKTTGLLGHQSTATGMITPGNLDHIKWCVQMFGGCRIGFNVPSFIMGEGPDKPWDLNPSADNTIVGGHDVPIVHYDSELFYVVTWGRIQPVTPAFIQAFNEEAHAELYTDWIDAMGVSPAGFNAGQLAQSLTEITDGD